MTEWIYSEELRAQLRRPRDHTTGRARDRDVARLLSPWRRHGAGPERLVPRD